MTSQRARAVEILEERSETQGIGTFGISLTGGEPTMHPDLPRIIRPARASLLPHEHDLERILFAAGTDQTLNKAGLQRMQLSIDGLRRTKQHKGLNNLKKRLQWLRTMPGLKWYQCGHRRLSSRGS